ncbi:DUF4082 domain-containing protein [Nocardioides nematodiphilus]|uniref:DUF4082 domain-containing protein n=1 Tax=Nocardioides nematodiphilus TaxID=2849669 RepID=UPI001CD9D0DA|nr:DUF4082 domain-containing protein [Nocardioides nematodiphilus]MCA1984435.1 DUF4082 domain-containing protein [Nocardioides nematodiphilus]
MGKFATISTLAVILFATTVLAPQAIGQDAQTGLWPTSFNAHQTAADCGRWKLSPDGFCVADDARNGLEVGVRFRTSQRVQITGVRIYRVDTATLTGSLWDASGRLLAHGAFAPGPANAWQDMRFAKPVTIAPGGIYVASYFTPRTRYAFRYDYFADAGRTVGPITAVAATTGHPNGVFCYDDAVCGSYPVRGYRNSSYWVTPLWNGATASGANAAHSAPPRVVRVRPGAHAAKATAPVKITFSKAIWPSTLTSTTVRLMHGTKPVATRLTYRPARHQAVLTARTGLRAGATYRVKVSTRVRDSQGHRLDQNTRRAGRQSATWTFHTR